MASKVASVSFRFERSSGWLVKYMSAMYSLGRRFEQRRFRRPHHVFGIEPLHQERHPGEPAFDPQHFEFRETLRQAVDDPVRQMDEVVIDERDRVHRDEAIALLHRLVAPVEAGMKGERLAGRLDRGIERHIAVVIDGAEARRGDRKADHARIIGIHLDRLHAGLGVIERQIQHRLDARILRQDFFGQPFVEGVADHDFHLDLRMHAEHQHRGRKHHHVIDAHRIHGALNQRHLGVGAAARDGFAEPLLVRDAAEDVLVEHARRGIEEAGRVAAFFEGARHLLVDVALHPIDDFGPERRLGDMGVDVDDEIIVLFSVLGGVREDVTGVGEII